MVGWDQPDAVFGTVAELHDEDDVLGVRAILDAAHRRAAVAPREIGLEACGGEDAHDLDDGFLAAGHSVQWTTGQPRSLIAVIDLEAATAVDRSRS